MSNEANSEPVETIVTIKDRDEQRDTLVLHFTIPSSLSPTSEWATDLTMTIPTASPSYKRFAQLRQGQDVLLTIDADPSQVGRYQQQRQSVMR